MGSEKVRDREGRMKKLGKLGMELGRGRKREEGSGRGRAKEGGGRSRNTNLY